MNTNSNDPMTHFAIEHLMGRSDGWRSLVREMVRLWPTVEILELCFAIVSAASAIDEMFDETSPSRSVSAKAYELAALLAADLYAMKYRGLKGHTAQDLANYWADHDPYFLTL